MEFLKSFHFYRRVPMDVSEGTGLGGLLSLVTSIVHNLSLVLSLFLCMCACVCARHMGYLLSCVVLQFGAVCMAILFLSEVFCLCCISPTASTLTPPCPLLCSSDGFWNPIPHLGTQLRHTPKWTHNGVVMAVDCVAG